MWQELILGPDAQDTFTSDEERHGIWLEAAFELKSECCHEVTLWGESFYGLPAADGHHGKPASEAFVRAFYEDIERGRIENKYLHPVVEVEGQRVFGRYSGEVPAEYADLMRVYGEYSKTPEGLARLNHEVERLVKARIAALWPPGTARTAAVIALETFAQPDRPATETADLPLPALIGRNPSSSP
jgi:hypothetical protein